MQIIVETADWDDFGGHWVEAGFDKFEISSSPSTHILESSTNNKELIKIVDILGREILKTSNVPVFYIYKDGSVEKKIVIE